MNAFGKLPNWEKFTYVFKGMEGESRALSAAYLFGVEYSKSAQDGRKVEYGTATRSINLGIGYDVGAANTQTTNLNQE